MEQGDSRSKPINRQRHAYVAWEIGERDDIVAVFGLDEADAFERAFDCLGYKLRDCIVGRCRPHDLVRIARAIELDRYADGELTEGLVQEVGGRIRQRKEARPL